MESTAEDIMNFYIEDGVLFGEYQQEFTMDFPTAKLLLEGREKVQNGRMYPGFFNFGKVQYADKETREFLITRGCETLTAAAFFTKNIAFIMFLNSVVEIYRPHMPLRVFSDRKKAINWLKKYRVAASL